MWDIKADCVFPCATQNEISIDDAQNIINNQVKLLAEGANMPLSNGALDIIMDSNILYAPGKASNAGGVAISGLEMAQNHMGVYWDKHQLDQNLRRIMKEIHNKCRDAAEKYSNPFNYHDGSNIAGFIKVADSIIAEGIV